MAESIFDLIYGEERFKKPQTGLMSSFDDTDYGDLTAQPEKDYLQEMKTRDKIALLTSAMPVVGGITGTYADAMNMIENPEERTLANAGLMALNWIPTGRGAREMVEKTKDSGVLANITTKNADKPDDAYQMTYWRNDGKYGDALDSRNLPDNADIYLGGTGRQTKDFILLDGGKVRGQRNLMRKDDYQDEEIFYTIYDKKTKKPVGSTKLVEQDVDGRRTITGLVDIKINDQNQGIGKKFIDNLRQSAKADPYSVAPEFKVFDVQEDSVGFWEKVGAKDFYERGEIGGTYGIKSANYGEYTQDIPKGFKPKKVTKDHKGQINTILEFNK